MGARRRWFSRARFRHAGQLDGRAVHQGDVGGVLWRDGPNGKEGQGERQPAVQLLLCARRLDVVGRMRVLSGRVEV